LTDLAAYECTLCESHPKQPELRTRKALRRQALVAAIEAAPSTPEKTGMLGRKRWARVAGKRWEAKHDKVGLDPLTLMLLGIAIQYAIKWLIAWWKSRHPTPNMVSLLKQEAEEA